ncbi:unnamed protein product [Pseudo-nitzschia multistriata]|uniref:ShKT domain-containing protein n=2 Tax=Pseudo-nitzschia multistriata TaxID=183589 RepID=A0A448ZND8_9STRA|nr:unnamed protein product [Pseudo-nitzschia multistriata]
MKVVAVFRALVTLLFFQKVDSQECGANGDCDSHQRCPLWEIEGECYRSPAYMANICPVSCSGMKGAPARTECYDVHKNCSDWAEVDECETNNAVKNYCPLSCGRCTAKATINTVAENTGCGDDNENCSAWADLGECDKNPRYMLEKCRKSCGVCHGTVTSTEKTQTKDFVDLIQRTANFGVTQTASGAQKMTTLDHMEKMMNYLGSDDYKSLPSQIKMHCKNQNELCSFWAGIGECENNKSFMKVQCAPACQSCHLIDIANRCPNLPDAIPGLKEGDLNKMFERIVEEAPGNRTLTDQDREKLALLEVPEYYVTVLSRPSEVPATEANIISDRKLPPWVITLDNFLTDEECDSLIQHGYEAGYKRSQDVGKQKFDGMLESKLSEGRTSENAWCTTRNGCRHATVPKRVLDRLANVVGIPPENSEDLQILKYEKGQCESLQYSP